MTTDTAIAHLTESDFNVGVIEPSFTMPVLVDFWADWCQPCKMLAPVLEQLQGELEEQLRVVKVNTDEQPQLAARFAIRSLPTLILFRQGEVVNELYGVQPLANLKAFVKPHLPRESDEQLAQASALADDGNLEQAISLLSRAVYNDADNYRVHPLLIRLLIRAGRTDEAERWFRELPANIQQSDELVKLEAILEFACNVDASFDHQAVSSRLKQDPGDLESRYRLATSLVMEENYTGAMDQLLEIIRRDRNWNDDAGRKALINVFRLLDNEGPLVKKYRGMLAAALN